MAPGIQLEPETFYQLGNSYGLYLDGTHFEGIPLVIVMIFFVGHPRHCYLEALSSHIHFSFLFTNNFSRQAKVCYFLLF